MSADLAKDKRWFRSLTFAKPLIVSSMNAYASGKAAALNVTCPSPSPITRFSVFNQSTYHQIHMIKLHHIICLIFLWLPSCIFIVDTLASLLITFLVFLPSFVLLQVYHYRLYLRDFKMVLKLFQTDALNGLCSTNQLDLLDSVDRLRSQDISHYVSLPQIIVCGDQSSEKSFVFEAISGVSFSVKSNLSIRFPIELILRKTLQTSVSVLIVSHQACTEFERFALSSFYEQLKNFEEFLNLIENAKAAIRISIYDKIFSKDLFRVEIFGLDRSYLTTINLFELIYSKTK